MKRTCVARSLALTAVLAATSLAQAQAVVIRVDPASPNPTLGNDWATAYHTIQEALADSRLEDFDGQHEIWVRGGTYSADALDPGNQNVSIELVGDTMVHGGFDGTEDFLPERDIDANPTVFSGIMPSSTDRSLHVVRADNIDTDENRRFGLHGITVSGGRAIRVDDLDPFENGRGGGLWVDSDGQRLGIAACVFEDNAAGIGGGMFIDTRTSPFGSPPPEGGDDGAINRLIVSSVFRNNEAGEGKDPFTVTVDRGGGGLAILGSFEFASVLNCLFHDNVVRGDDSPSPAFRSGGAAILLLKSRPVLDQLTVMNNSAELGAVAGGIYAGSSATPVGPGVAKVDLRNSIVYGNDRDTVLDFAAQIDADDPVDEIQLISHSCVQAIDTSAWSDANIADDPILLFTDAAARETSRYALAACSPCIDVADSAVSGDTLFRDALDVDDDGDLTEPTPDIVRLSRITPGVPPTAGNPNPPSLPDMGAQEFLVQPCPADLDDSNAVEFDDLLLVLSEFGELGGPEDLDGNGTVDFGDILVILSAFGPCPGFILECFDEPLDELGDISECLNLYASEPAKLAACIEAVQRAQAQAGSGGS